MAVSARLIVTFLSIVCMGLSIPYGYSAATELRALKLHTECEVAEFRTCVLDRELWFEASSHGNAAGYDVRPILIQRGVMKDFFYGQSEKPGGPEGQRKARIELACFNRVDGLTGYIQGVGQLGLRPVALSAQHLEPILHRYRQVPYRLDTTKVSPMIITRCEMSAWKGIT